MTFEECITFQDKFLQNVSRTFALTIPQLPPPLYLSVGNAYLLCRIADTIEDDPDMMVAEKKYFASQFSAVVRGDQNARVFGNDLAQRLSAKMPNAEHELVANTVPVIAITHSLAAPQRQALERCVEIMGSGMAKFQQTASTNGLADIAQFNQYCYFVAGVVGEMLTELFCDYSAEINQHREELLTLAIGFGQGLQMTNILKDIWDDKEREICWLPRDVFLKYGVKLENFNSSDPRVIKGIQELVLIAHQNLQKALQYILIIPSRETGIRRHCLSALGMAALTLRKIYNNPEFTHGAEVKISRRSVKFIMYVTNLLVRSNLGLQFLFAVLMYDFRAQKIPD